MQTLGSTSVPALLKYLRHAERLGLDIAPALAAAGLQADQLNDNRQRLPGEAHERLLGYFCEHSGDPLFGLHSARFVQPGSWSVLGYIAMNCATLGEAMSRITPYEKLVGDMGTSRIEAAGGQVRLIWNCRHQTPLVRRHMVEHVLASWVLYARWIADLEGSPDEVWLEHDLPDGTRVEDYETFFGCPVRFAQPCSALLVPLDYLALPLRQADATLLRTLEEHALALMAELDDDEPLPLRVKNALRQLLKDGLPRKERVAEKFGMTVRTLQRHLQQAGSSYQQTLDELRRELAEHYLLHSELPIQDIAQYLGFTESRSFHRSFKGWTGQTPGEYRQRRKSRRRENGGHPAAVGSIEQFAQRNERHALAFHEGTSLADLHQPLGPGSAAQYPGTLVRIEHRAACSRRPRRYSRRCPALVQAKPAGTSTRSGATCATPPAQQVGTRQQGEGDQGEAGLPGRPTGCPGTGRRSAACRVLSPASRGSARRLRAAPCRGSRPRPPIRRQWTG